MGRISSAVRGQITTLERQRMALYSERLRVIDDIELLEASRDALMKRINDLDVEIRRLTNA